jgi:hypothetical protein
VLTQTHKHVLGEKQKGEKRRRKEDGRKKRPKRNMKMHNE